MPSFAVGVPRAFAVRHLLTYLAMRVDFTIPERRASL